MVVVPRCILIDGSKTGSSQCALTLQRRKEEEVKNFQSSELSHRIWYIYDIKWVRWIDSYGLTGYDLGQDRT